MIPIIGQRYRVSHRLGQGGMSRVYLCWDERLQLWCAIKVMTAESTDDPVLRARFVQEARTLARLDHPNLVRLYELVDDVACPYMVMEYMEAGTVASRLSRGPIHLHHALSIIADTAAALSAAHGAGVVHRDVKPQNMLLDGAGTVKVGDFGVARVHEDLRLTMSNMSLGTLAYMPPEQQRDASKVDHRADLYGAGATLFALSTGRRPTGLLTQDRESAMALVPPEARPIVRRATELSRSHRYESAAAMESALREALRRVPLPADAPPLVDRTDPPPAQPPREGDRVSLEADELAGTDVQWSGVPVRLPDRPLTGDKFQSIDPSRDSAPPPTQILALPRRPRRRGWLGRAVTVIVAVTLGLTCGGGCVATIVAALGGAWAW